MGYVGDRMILNFVIRWHGDNIVRCLGDRMI